MSIVSTEPTEHGRHEREGRPTCGVASLSNGVTLVCKLPILHPGWHHSKGISWPRLTSGDVTLSRPDFADITLAHDLLKLQEDFIGLAHRAQREPVHVPGIRDDSVEVLVGPFGFRAMVTREALIKAEISYGTATVVRDMLEAAFQVCRRALNGIPDPDQPIDLWPTEVAPS